MTPERIAEINRIACNLDRENPAYGALNEALDALEAAQHEIAVDAGRLRDAAMRVWGEDAHGCDTPDRLADAILGLRTQIADLKRGGVVVPEWPLDGHDDRLDEIRCWKSDPIRGVVEWNAINRTVAWMRARLRAIPADRVLGDGMVQVSQEERLALGECSMVLRAYSKTHGIGVAAIERLDALRANQGGADCV